MEYTPEIYHVTTKSDTEKERIIKRYSKGFKFFKTFFITGCIIASFVLAVQLIYEYSLNNDTSSVEFKAFHSDESAPYPSISLCFGDVYKNDTEFSHSDIEKYQHFLTGYRGLDCKNCSWDPSLADKDHDEVTKNLVDYVIGEITKFDDETQLDYIYKKFPDRNTKVYGKTTAHYGYTGGSRVYTSSRKDVKKCLTFDIPFKKGKLVRAHAILLNNKIFAGSIRPKKFDFEVSFHYPNQILRQTSFKHEWSNVSKLLDKTCEDDREDYCAYYGSTYTMNYEVGGVTVLKRRKTGKEPCLNDWKNDDIALKIKISENINCQPSHWKLGLNLTKCRSKNEMASAWLKEENPPVPSCNSIERYTFMYNEEPGLNFYDIGSTDFKDTFDIDWIDDDVDKEVVSEIVVTFVGKNDILLRFEIQPTLA